MISPSKIVDRGRLLIGLMLVLPVAALVPTGVAIDGGGGGSAGADAGVWTASNAPNPIEVDLSPEGVMATFTQRTLQGRQVVTQGATRKETLADARAVKTAGEVGSEIIGSSAPTGTWADQLRESQLRNTPVGSAGATPAAAAPSGTLPVAAPGIARFPVPAASPHVFPVAGGASFTDDWGGPRPGGRRHQGIDLFARTGTPIVAITDGTLFKVGWNNVGGWRFWLRDRWGNEYYHAHLSAFAPAAREGAVVPAGTVIGYVGNTGDARTTPPHLHFEIHPVGGPAIPPFQYVSAWPRV